MTASLVCPWVCRTKIHVLHPRVGLQKWKTLTKCRNKTTFCLSKTRQIGKCWQQKQQLSLKVSSVKNWSDLAAFQRQTVTVMILPIGFIVVTPKQKEWNAVRVLWSCCWGSVAHDMRDVTTNKEKAYHYWEWAPCPWVCTEDCFVFSKCQPQWWQPVVLIAVTSHEVKFHL